MGIKAIVFDIGGVLMFESGRESQKALSLKFGFDSDKFKDYAINNLEGSYLGKTNGGEFFQGLKDELGLDIEVSELIEGWLNGRRSSYFYEGVADVVKELRGRYTIASLTDSTKLNDVVRKEMGVYDLFDENVISSEEGVRKPDVEIYKILLERLGLDASEIVFVDDKEENLAIARELGMGAVLFRGEDGAENLRNKLKNFGVEI